MNNEQIKKELHELVDGLDIEAASKDVAARIGGNGGFFCLSYSTIEHVTNLLKSHQTHKENPLKKKLIDMGFVKKSDARYIFEKNNITVYFCLERKICTIIHGDNKFCNDSDNHNQIFADIAYLESRIKWVQ